MLLRHKYINDITHVFKIKDIELKNNIVYKKCSVQIFDILVKELKNKQIALVKVLWKTIKLR